ncbi:uncharacterized protein VTP21DRAFT_7309 [Calcarisporiella thermophila]|uniref:uncharacterized protein n=1 Tax=Calcarisporiella thermophila TaxID=911321 RepID=UPI003742690F
MHNDLNPYGLFVAAIVALASFQFGYHTGVLNIPKDVIASCKSKDTIANDASEGFLSNYPFGDDSYLPPCLQMSESTWSFLVALLTLGGLVGSLTASSLANRYGRRWTLILNNAAYTIGSLVMGFATTPSWMMVGRFLTGVGCGVAIVVVPIYLVEIAPVSLRGIFGVINQLGIVTGILASQLLGMWFSTFSLWRVILLIGAAISIVQLALLPMCVESPRYLATRPGGYSEAKRSLQKLRGHLNVEDELSSWLKVKAEDTQGLISSAEQRDEAPEENPPEHAIPAIPAVKHITPFQLFTIEYRRPLMIILLVHLTQQFSGINGVIFYSTPILSEVMPTSSDLITVFISIVNTAMTVVSAYLMDRAGRRTLLLLSSSTMMIASLLLSFSMSYHFGFLSAVSSVAFVATFAVGLGPIPFLLASEIVETRAAAAASSLGLVVNWSANFTVTYLFLMLKTWLGGGVFMLFAAVLAISTWAIYRIVPETKNKTLEEITRSWSRT